MKKTIYSIAFLASGLFFVNTSFAQTRYGDTETIKDGYEGTYYSCPQNNPTRVCQVWGNNADGSRFVVVLFQIVMLWQ